MLKKFRFYFDLSLSCFILSGIDLLLIPLVKPSGEGFSKALMYIVGLVFWLSLVAGILFFLETNSRCKIIETRLTKKNGKRPINVNRCGAFSFFQNKEAKIADICMLLMFIVTVTISLIKTYKIGVVFFFIVLFYICVVFHCFINGKNYKYLSDYKKYLKIKQQREKVDV